MRFSSSLLTVAGLASASNLKAESAEPRGDVYPGYFENPEHRLADYSQDYKYVLPSADFNKQVYDFNDNVAIFDQSTYEARIRVEAEMMIALEALKESIKIVGTDFENLRSINVSHRGEIIDNLHESEAQLTAARESYSSTASRLDSLLGECHMLEKDIQQSRRALILYCQQFAFDQAMVEPCKPLLHGRQTLLRYKFGF
mmetsp:Transcript_37978/g.46345  ORF Transcript_37978/g.46345 Transcript_37978/m.46345 type:complete len:200 (+) Transcript_37978:70-669(+)